MIRWSRELKIVKNGENPRAASQDFPKIAQIDPFLDVITSILDVITSILDV